MPYGPKRLRPEHVWQIRTFYESGEYTQKQLGEMFDVSQALVCKIVNNQVHKKAANLSFAGNADVRLGYHYANS